MKHKWGTREWFEKQNLPEAESLGDKWGHRWRGSQKFRHELALGLIKEIIADKDGMAILDIGCALGDFTVKVHNINPENKICAIDISQNAVNYVSQKYPWLEAQVGALPTIPFPDNAFDLVIALEVLYYLGHKDREKAVREIKRVLKPGGYCLISGVLDGGKRYFSEEAIMELLSEYFVLEAVRFNFAKPYTYIEGRLLSLYSKLTTVQRMVALSDEEFQELLNEKPEVTKVVLRKVRKLFTMPLLGWIVKWPLQGYTWLLRNVLSLKIIPAFFIVFSKFLAVKAAKSHIILLCKNEYHE